MVNVLMVTRENEKMRKSVGMMVGASPGRLCGETPMEPTVAARLPAAQFTSMAS
jgi:hypothetical protein